MTRTGVLLIFSDFLFQWDTLRQVVYAAAESNAALDTGLAELHSANIR
jgi:hypothetical protein